MQFFSSRWLFWWKMLRNMAYLNLTSFSTSLRFRTFENFFLSNWKTDLSLKSWKVRISCVCILICILFCLVSGRDQKILCFTESHAALLSTKHANFLCSDSLKHRLRMPNGAFFHQNTKLLSLGRQFGQIYLGAF